MRIFQPIILLATLMMTDGSLIAAKATLFWLMQIYSRHPIGWTD